MEVEGVIHSAKSHRNNQRFAFLNQTDMGNKVVIQDRIEIADLERSLVRNSVERRALGAAWVCHGKTLAERGGKFLLDLF